MPYLHEKHSLAEPSRSRGVLIFHQLHVVSHLYESAWLLPIHVHHVASVELSNNTSVEPKSNDGQREPTRGDGK